MKLQIAIDDKQYEVEVGAKAREFALEFLKACDCGFGEYGHVVSSTRIMTDGGTYSTSMGMSILKLNA